MGTVSCPSSVAAPAHFVSVAAKIVYVLLELLFAPCSMPYHGQLTTDNRLLEFLQYLDIGLLPTTGEPTVKSLVFLDCK